MTKKQMTKERFAEILKEYDYTKKQIDIIWGYVSNDEMSEKSIRRTAAASAPYKDSLRQE